ncbi:enoyl-ACP reductase FabI [Pyrinomonas methylaliphatogenes]|uniref:Enoyl-[acyl-carrier-protein] reductase [NADH] n=1 Tax=Pyrinomonas methylaliphatogenes TaxID=454194 RepID=A0A0B6WVQ8_9BACT|nr:enoyl-ACP reductase [Pyrinomonas methylaliphatogenes]CDM64210.1 Enoyl-(acyl-carrier-protein) reductase (NADH) [Pyrinomonas methylaliphatogenes]
MIDLRNKLGIIFGVANKRSIAWATAQALAEAGARLALTYQNERLRENVEELAQSLAGSITMQCDVTRPEEVAQTFARVREEFGRLDFLIHSIAYAPREALEGEYLQTSREAFLTALEISAYSLTELARAAAPLMTDGGSIVTMTYYGAEKVVPHYNVMGVAKAALEASTRYLAAELGQRNIRVNAISAGPIQTLAARGIGNLTTMLKHHAERAPLRRNVEAREVAHTALFLCSALSSGITGEVIHVDCGYNIMAF